MRPSSSTPRRGAHAFATPLVAAPPAFLLLFVGLLSLSVTSLGASGCVVDNAGSAPSPGELNFPVAIVSTPEVGGRQFLLVANANFDLRYNSGALQSYDLTAMREAARACADPPCSFDDSRAFLVSEVWMGSYATGMALSPRGDRVYLAVRSEVDLTWIDLDPATGALSCEGAGQPETCAPRRRTTDVATGCGRELEISGDPIGLVATRASESPSDPASSLDAVVMIHRNGRASLFLDRLVDGRPEPQLVDVNDGLPYDITNISFDPTSRLIWTHSAYVSAARASRAVGFAGFAIDPAEPECSSVFSAGRVEIRGVDDGFDTRDATFSSDGQRAYVLARRPEAILTLALDREGLFAGEAPIVRLSHVGFAPTRIDRVEVNGNDVLVASCFDDRRVWFVDASTGHTRGVVPGFQGPFELTPDPGADWVWVVDFRDSVLRAIDYGPLASGGEPRLMATFGAVRPVRVLQ